MLPWLVLFCIVLAPSAAFLLWSWRASRDDMSLMRATQTTPAGPVGAVLCFGSAGWLVWSGLHQAEPPREVLQGGSVW
jgi:hypothetical protein